MLNEKIAKMLNEQITRELFSAYLYLDFANYYEDEALAGFAHWYEVQAQEERDHALIMRQYLLDNDCKVTLAAIDAPDMTFTDHIEPIKAALEHEKYVTSLINNIYAAADAVKDYRTMKFLDWFVDEQLEEEANASDLLTKMKLFGTDAKALYDLDQEYAARAYTQAAPLAAN